MRLFVALDIPEAVRAALRELVRRLEPACRGARWVRVENIHLTVKFIGHVAPEKAEQIRAALGTIRLAAPVDMRFRNVGFFPNARRPRVFWAGTEASPNLAELAEAVEAALEPLGIPREQRSFKPHLTLARFKSEEGLPAMREAIAALPSAEFGAAQATEFHLYESQLRPGGAEYERRATFPIVEGGA